MDEFNNVVEVMGQSALPRRLMVCRARESDKSPSHNMNVSQTTPRIPGECSSADIFTGRHVAE